MPEEQRQQLLDRIALEKLKREEELETAERIARANEQQEKEKKLTYRLQKKIKTICRKS